MNKRTDNLRSGRRGEDINYPTVAKGTERLRFTPGPFHTDLMLYDMVIKLRDAMRHNKIV
jgi:5-aminolevulinate synthase